MYQDTIYEHDEGALEVFYDINERLQTYLLITLDRQPYSVEPLNVLLINSIRGVFILDEEEVGQTLGFINNALATTTDPQLYFGILNFLIAVEHGITDEERNTMFKESIYKVFKAMNELNFIDTEEEKLDLFAQYLAEYIQDRQIEIDDDYVTSLIEEVEPLFKSYDYTDIVDAMYNQLDS